MGIEGVDDRLWGCDEDGLWFCQTFNVSNSLARL